MYSATPSRSEIKKVKLFFQFNYIALPQYNSLTVQFRGEHYL